MYGDSDEEDEDDEDASGSEKRRDSSDGENEEDDEEIEKALRVSWGARCWQLFGVERTEHNLWT